MFGNRCKRLEQSVRYGYFLVAGFLAGAFLAAGFFAGAFLAVDGFLAGAALLAAGLLAAGFFSLLVPVGTPAFLALRAAWAFLRAALFLWMIPFFAALSSSL